MSRNDELKARGEAVIPGGMYGHMSTYRMLPEGYPQYFERGEGCRLWDVDGKEYIDFMCSYGPMIAGYANPRIRAAADRQRETLDIGNAPAPVIVDLAEKLTKQVTHAEWAIFGKNGNDATTICNQIARGRTGRRKILVAKGAYHGAQPWASRRTRGTPEEDYVHFPMYTFNDVASVTEAVREHSGDIAGIVVSAYRHDAGFHQELTDPDFAKAVRALCDQQDAALILDDVRAGMRLSLDASWSAHGVHPDLSAWGKAIANGEPIAAVLGSEPWREAAAQTFVTGSFWYQAAPMAASIETLSILQEENAPVRLEAMGQRFRDGIYEQAQRHGHSVLQTGPAAMPTLMFEDDKDSKLGFAFCQAALKEGVYLHPWHNMFLSLAHTEADIDQALEGTNRAFSAI